MIIISDHQKKFKITTIINAILVFMYLYDILILNVPSIFSSRKIIFSLIIMFFLLFFKHYRPLGFMIEYRRQFQIIGFVIIYIICYLVVLMVVYEKVEYSNYVISRVAYFGIYAIIGSYLFGKYFTSIFAFFKGIIIADLIQSTIVYCQFIFVGFRNFLNNMFTMTGNISYLRQDRANGIGAEGANLSLLLFCGLFACSYLILKKQKTSLCLIITYFYILIASMLVGRTGFYFGLVNIFILVILTLGKKTNFEFLKNIIKIVIGIVIILITFNFVTTKYIDSARMENIFIWATSLSNNGLSDRSFIQLSNMEIPKLTIETLFGTGIYRGISDLGTIMQHDSGYVQSYFSMGLINALFFYYMFYRFLILLISKINDKVTRRYFYWFFITIVIVEVKEPFILKYMLPFVLITSCILVRKTEKFICENN